MSVESAKAFIKRMATEEDFAREVTALETDEARKQYAIDAGYDFTREDVEQLLPSDVTLDEVLALEWSATDELPEGLLEAVVGGKGNKPEWGFGIGGDWSSSAAI